MTRQSPRRRGLTALIASTPAIAAIFLVGQSLPASAQTYFSTCPSSGYACFYGATNWTPFNNFHDILGLQGTNGNWGNFGDSSLNGEACGGTNWNDCASSDRNHLSSDMYVWQDINCQTGVLVLPSSTSYDLANQTFSDGVTANNNISSDRMSAGTGC